jgi:hypothetical protein
LTGQKDEAENHEFQKKSGLMIDLILAARNFPGEFAQGKMVVTISRSGSETGRKRLVVSGQREVTETNIAAG